MAPLYFRHPASLEHDTGAHPERVDRIRAIEAELDGRDWLGFERREAPRVEEERLLAVHSDTHLEAVRKASASSRALDLDTPTSPGSWEAALRSAGGACALVEALLEGEATVGFGGLRPPGHHAGRAKAMGFCLFNNIAVAARHALDSLGAERVFVLDWDVHHGNGTNSLFRSSAEVLYASIHQWPFYPGTGPLDDAGKEEGEGYSINLPVPAGSGDDVWLSLVEHVVTPAARAFDPDLVLISAGYDAHRDDPIGGCQLTSSSYAELSRHARSIADEADAPVGALLEGGYDLDALADSVAATMEALEEGGEPGSVARHELTEKAAEQVGRYWDLPA